MCMFTNFSVNLSILIFRVVQKSGLPWATLHSTYDTNIELLQNFGNYLQIRTKPFNKLLVYVDPRTVHTKLGLVVF